MSITKKSLITTSAVVVSMVVIGASYIYIQNHPLAQPGLPTPAVSDLTPDNLLKQVNEQRAKAGVPPLRLEPLMNKSAQRKADEIQTTGKYSHVNSQGVHGYQYIEQAGVKGCTNISENLDAATTTHEAISEWLASKPHREAMLDPRYDLTGFGISNGPGYQYVVEHFCDLP